VTFLFLVMAGLVPAIHDFFLAESAKSWMPGTRPGMTEGVIPASESCRMIRPISARQGARSRGVVGVERGAAPARRLAAGDRDAPAGPSGTSDPAAQSRA